MLVPREPFCYFARERARRRLSPSGVSTLPEGIVGPALDDGPFLIGERIDRAEVVGVQIERAGLLAASGDDGDHALGRVNEIPLLRLRGRPSG